ncbi:peptidase domain-containing ABC transporter [Calothrix sp. FACHB-1219]|uniref:peptidase domain-containing ABC transporter n=1 Tax=unclassified Calothrix TaxID=2619626 RepID=UPI001687EB13|nr:MULTISPECIES: peptidase domain-containing ABC transporter [unclassified Calothrix]MBD2201901.1 peptidase domain-containing ABC transporter [Calothrix sp. FACHB-168]MBD2216936.1 peptidase domain-containing ABC transporter [Calothrix sp. FACHB-1219]
MTPIITQTEIVEFLSATPPFNIMGFDTVKTLADRCQLLQYRPGQWMLVKDRMPAQVMIIYQGQARVLAEERWTNSQVSLTVLEPGEFVGWLGLVRGESCEAVMASTEVIAITLEAGEFQRLLEREPEFAVSVRSRSHISEVFELLSQEIQRHADATTDIKDLARQVWQDTQVINLPPGSVNSQDFDEERLWLVSAGSIEGIGGSDRLPLSDKPQTWQNSTPVRLLGIPWNYPPEHIASIKIAPAPEYPPDPIAENLAPAQTIFVAGKGKIDTPLACFQMLHQILGGTFRRDLIRKVVTNQLKANQQITLQVAGAVVEMMGLQAHLVKVPVHVINRLNAPAIIYWQENLALLYKITEREIVVAAPEIGVNCYHPAEFAQIWGESGQVLTVETTESDRPEKFSLRWFIPSILKFRLVLFEVLVASFFVQIFGLANPIVTQIIIDTVLIQKSLDTLDILGIFLLVIGVFEAALTSLRIYLFADTTNRIDIRLGSEVIEHLLRLPLSYFERRRVGELAGRINELENIRQFLTGTALTVVLDAIFSVIYIGIMLFYSWMLTLVALATVPLFAILTTFVVPIVQQQLRKKAERYADTQSYLVEILTGIQTVKAQNIELKSRWQWRDRYTRYISAGFKNVLTSSTANSISGFLNQFSSFVLLWAGAHLVISNQLSLGQLIAFRIIAGYVTSPLLRLIQLSQSFQEVALSIERLGDILDSEPEVKASDRQNIQLPEIAGAIKYNGVSFGFHPEDSLKLININLEIPPGTFVGIVGQSGSGKSTLTKLLPRLYEPVAGQIQIDGYDIRKVELNSLRRQIGIVLQDTLLFEGTIQDNIALIRPEATTEEIIAAAKTAAAHDFIMALPDGYNTIVGERGSALSGGQRQRIAIARTVLQNPRLLILDEATSALDYESEQQVCRNLMEFFQGSTVLFITHRLNTVKNADTIIIMDKGVIAEQGTHAQLMTMRGRYYCLFQQQESQL